jgi:electron transfer flavoprotein alpha subunit
MSVLLLAEHEQGQLKAATRNAVTAAKAIGGDLHVLVVGSGVAAVRTPRLKSTASPRCWSPTPRSTPTRWPSR